MPSCTHGKLEQSLKIASKFTGDLEHQHGDMSERDYLRARLSDIVHTTTLSPRGFYEMHGDRLVVNQDFDWPERVQFVNHLESLDGGTRELLHAVSQE